MAHLWHICAIYVPFYSTRTAHVPSLKGLKSGFLVLHGTCAMNVLVLAHMCAIGRNLTKKLKIMTFWLKIKRIIKKLLAAWGVLLVGDRNTIKP